MQLTPRSALLATALLAVTAVAGYVLARAWRLDDQCFIAEWKCSAGDIGLVLMILGGFAAAVTAVLTVVVWARSSRRPRSPR